MLNLNKCTLCKWYTVHKQIRHILQKKNRVAYLAINAHFRCCKIHHYCSLGNMKCNQLQRWCTPNAGLEKLFYKTIRIHQHKACCRTKNYKTMLEHDLNDRITGKTSTIESSRDCYKISINWTILYNLNYR